jgi:3-dehydroquinate synthase
MQQIIKSTHLYIDIENAINTISYDKLFILTDEHTNALCLPLIGSSKLICEATKIIIQAEDTNKNIENLSRVWKQLTENGATRHSLLINLGGGMVTDLGGFAAATFKRGITYINVPTTLLGAVDAAVGGKTGINFEGYKNEIGAFYPAESVIISSDFFKTLNRSAILSGYAEMLKHALIDSQSEWEKLLAFSLEHIDYKLLNEMVFRSVEIKQNIVTKDPYENSIRKALNFGHTAGHAFESFAIEHNKPIPHGYAVAWGMIVELYLSHKLCGFSTEKLTKTVRFIQQQYSTFDTVGERSRTILCDDYEALYEITTHDKKNQGNAVNYTLLSDIGEVKIDQIVDKELFFEALDFYRDSVGL